MEPLVRLHIVLRNALMESGVEKISVRTLSASNGNGTVEARVGIAVQGNIVETSVFSGTLAGYSFVVQFNGDKFSGSVSLNICQVKVSAKRKK